MGDLEGYNIIVSAFCSASLYKNLPTILLFIYPCNHLYTCVPESLYDLYGISSITLPPYIKSSSYVHNIYYSIQYIYRFNFSFLGIQKTIIC